MKPVNIIVKKVNKIVLISILHYQAFRELGLLILKYIGIVRGRKYAENVLKITRGMLCLRPVPGANVGTDDISSRHSLSSGGTLPEFLIMAPHLDRSQPNSCFLRV